MKSDPAQIKLSHRSRSAAGLARLVLVVALCLSDRSGFAAETSGVVGLWKLVSYQIEVQATGEKAAIMGERPSGYATFSSDGRVFFMLTGDGRKPAKTDLERAELLNTLVAYTGMYRIEGDRWITKVDVAWNPEWVGTEQVRSFKIEGDQLQVFSPWRVMPNWAEKGTTRSIVTFERTK
ncbi:lipocalin-like domain-containing protein [Bradyrhizobium sp. HKCCYLS1011]|uniref:lipocalin-like domain-containing protein n=1 Tax=Bradyrhizobium sp. HKCCYLS1011 TaxID=3420733 RepID=UPI003EBEFC75